MTLANDLVRFLMSLFADRQAARDFLDAPERVLQDHGLGGVGTADVDAAMAVVLDYAPITVTASWPDREYNPGGNRAGAGHNGGGAVITPPAGGRNGGRDDHGRAVHQLHQVVTTYACAATVDGRDNGVDQAVNQAVNQDIWAGADARQWFEDDSVAR